MSGTDYIDLSRKTPRPNFKKYGFMSEDFYSSHYLREQEKIGFNVFVDIPKSGSYALHQGFRDRSAEYLVEPPSRLLQLISKDVSDHITNYKMVGNSFLHERMKKFDVMRKHIEARRLLKAIGKSFKDLMIVKKRELVLNNGNNVFFDGFLGDRIVYKGMPEEEIERAALSEADFDAKLNDFYVTPLINGCDGMNEQIFHAFTEEKRCRTIFSRFSRYGQGKEIHNGKLNYSFIKLYRTREDGNFSYLFLSILNVNTEQQGPINIGSCFLTNDYTKFLHFARCITKYLYNDFPPDMVQDFETLFSKGNFLFEKPLIPSGLDPCDYGFICSRFIPPKFIRDGWVKDPYHISGIAANNIPYEFFDNQQRSALDGFIRNKSYEE